MRVLYGVQGTGNGHITRARAMAEEFKKLDVDVDYIFSGRPQSEYFDMDCFGQYRTFKGLSFVAKDGRVDLLATYRKAELIQLMRDILTLDVSQYDLIITDFEPIVAWAARKQKRDCIGIGHQYAFGHDIPKFTGDSLGSWLLARFAPVSKPLGVHWHHFGAEILPPIIQSHTAVKPADERSVLVYLPFENSEEVMEWLEAVPDYQFRMHCKDIEPGKYGNVEVFPFSRNGFQKNLTECQSVLCNAGFELNSEALQLGRRILVKPLHGQVEQRSNVIALETLGFANSVDQLSTQAIHDWLESSKVIKVSYPDVAHSLAQWVSLGASDSLEQLCHSLWSGMPPVNGIQFSDIKMEFAKAI